MPQLINFKRTHFTCDVIIRDFHLIDYSYGSSIFEGHWAARGGKDYADTAADSKFPVLDRFKFAKRVAAQCIPLDIPAMCLDNKAKYDLNNVPWLKMLGFSVEKFLFKLLDTKKTKRLTYPG